MSEHRMKRITRLAKEGGWILAGQIVAVSGALMLVRVLTHNLDPTQYGQLALGLTIAGLVNQVAMGGVTSGIGRFYSISLEKGDLWGYLQASNLLMGYATIFACAIALVCIIGLVLIGQMQWLWLAISILTFSILSGYNSALSAIQNAARQRLIVALHGGMDAWLKIGLALGIMLWFGSNSTAVVSGYALSALLVTVSQLFFLRRLLHHNGEITYKSGNSSWVRQMWLFSWPMMAGGLFNWGYYASQRWALELFVSTADVGKFYALTQVAYSPISIAFGMFMSMLLPILYTRVGDPRDNQRIENVRDIVSKVVWIGIAATLVITAITLFWHQAIFSLLVADEYNDVSRYMPMTVMAAGLLQVSMAISINISVTNLTFLFLPKDIIGNASIAALNLLATWHYGLDGLLFSMVIGSLIHLIWMIIIANRARRNVLPDQTKGT